MRETEIIRVNFMLCSDSELRAAERRQAQLENAGYSLVAHVGNTMTYRKV
jgi:hypothetical protein